MIELLIFIYIVASRIFQKIAYSLLLKNNRSGIFRIMYILLSISPGSFIVVTIKNKWVVKYGLELNSISITLAGIGILYLTMTMTKDLHQ